MQMWCLAVSMLWCSLFVTDLVAGMEDLELHYRCRDRSNFREIRIATIPDRIVPGTPQTELVLKSTETRQLFGVPIFRVLGEMKLTCWATVRVGESGQRAASPPNLCIDLCGLEDMRCWLNAATKASSLQMTLVTTALFHVVFIGVQ